MPRRPGAATKPPPAREAAGDPTEPQDEALPGEESDNGTSVVEDLELVPLPEDDEDEPVFTVWYGDPGSTKTTSLVRTLLARPVGNLIVCNAEGGLKLRALRQWGIPTERIRVWPKPGVRPTFDALEQLVIKIEGELAAARREGRPKPYCGFGMDSATEVVKLMLDNVLEDGVAAQREIDARARAAGQTPPRRNARKRFKTERDDYNLVSQQMRAILRKLRYLGIDVGFTALVRRDEDQDTGQVKYGPAVPPALQQDLIGYADLVIHTVREEDENGKERVVGYARPDARYHGKDRYGMLPAEITPPAFDVILPHILGEPAVVHSQDSEPDPGPAETETEPVEEKPPAKATTRKSSNRKAATPRGNGRIDPKTVTAVGEGDGTDDEPPF